MWEKYKLYWFILFACLVFFLLPGGRADARIDSERFYCPSAAVFIVYVNCGIVRVITVNGGSINVYRLNNIKNLDEINIKLDKFLELFPAGEYYETEVVCL